MSRCVHGTIRAIATLKQRFIKFPDNTEFNRLQTAFYQKRGIPGVLGAIDGTHVPIVQPRDNDSELYRNRKGLFSINVQLMCASDLIIRNVVASWKGSTHDSRIFHESTLKDRLECLPAKYHILGDRGYPCTRYLFTPLANPQTPAEKRYNFAQSSTRMIIE